MRMLISWMLHRLVKLSMTQIKFEVCDKCKGTNVKSLVPKLRTLDPTAEIKTRCIRFCGVGREKIVILMNQVPIIGETEEEILGKIKEKMAK